MALKLRFGLKQTAKISKYIIANKLAGKKYFPVVLMLEPLHNCNLKCVCCGRIKEYAGSMDQQMTLEQCLQAVKDSGAPVISICGGEPLIYKEIVPLCQELIKQKKVVYLCTNGLLLEKAVEQLTPSPYFNINVHLDGMEKTHEQITQMPGSFTKTIEGIKKAKAKGFYLCTNTTIYRQTDLQEIASLFDLLTEIKIDGFLLSPGYEYEAVENKDTFLLRQETEEKFKYLASLKDKYRYLSTPVFLNFLTGNKDLHCTPWGNVTYTPVGWKAPCYLITDKHFDNYQDFIKETDWQKYRSGLDQRCKNCMVHSGFEATVALGTENNLKDYWQLIKWNLFS